MFEHKSQPLATKKVFFDRMVKASLCSLSLFALILTFGILGYHKLAGLEWLDSFLNASMILGGMGPIDDFSNAPDIAKLFGGIYALLSGVFFLSGFAIIIAPIVHRIMHKFHIEESNRNN